MVEILGTLAMLSSSFSIETLTFDTADLTINLVNPLLISTVLPIIYRKQINAIAHSEQLFSAFMDHLPGYAWIKNIDGRYVYINERLKQLPPFQQDFLGKTDADLWPSELAAEYRGNDLKVIQSGETVETVESFVLNGEQRCVLVSKFPIFDENGAIVMVGGTSVDITEHSRTEEALNASRHYLQALFDNSLDAILVANDEGRYIDANPAACLLLGYTREELMQLDRAALNSEPFGQERWATWQQFLASGSQRGECSVLRKDGSLIHLEFRAVANILPGVHVSSSRDITERKSAEEAQHDAEQKYRNIFENAVEGIFQTSPDGRFVVANPALARMFGFSSPEELIRERADISKQHYVDPKRREEFKRRLEEEGIVHNFEFEAYRKDGTKIWVSDNVRAVRDQSGTVLCYEGTVRDITERKRAEGALRESEERYRELFENAKDATYVHDLSGRYLSVNRAAEKLSGYTRGEILGRSFINFVPSEQIEKISEHLCRKLVAEGETSYESEVITKDGRRVAVEVNSHLIFENGVAIGVQGTARDITERKAAEEKLRATSEQLRALSARLQSAREEEGTRIAREIHDELGAMLTSLKWDLEGAERILANPIEPAQVADLREKLNALRKLADVAIQAIRRIASELRPSVLDDLGLVAAIEWQAQQFQARTGIVCSCDCALEKLELSEEQSTAVFRILQEALTNVLRHAQATRVDIEINKENGYFTLSISDNGKGITEREKSEQQSLGILGMRERAHLIAGEIDIKGVQGKGTLVTIRVSISGQDRVLKMTR
jgi:PAS domain S-box-containing protein